MDCLDCLFQDECSHDQNDEDCCFDFYFDDLTEIWLEMSYNRIIDIWDSEFNEYEEFEW